MRGQGKAGKGGEGGGGLVAVRDCKTVRLQNPGNHLGNMIRGEEEVGEGMGFPSRLCKRVPNGVKKKLSGG